jgi:NAD(P)-dependent dehydrogenase (short-subunit alcohol dehydrogenase family)
MDKTVMITGSNSGIGKAAAFRFAEEGYRVIMACRNLEKSKTVQQEIIQTTNNPNIDLLEIDISSCESIHKFHTSVKETYPKVDILIHNAAYLNHGNKNYQLSEDGVELSFATNVVGPFLLTKLLTDQLAKSDDARILHACTTNIRHFFDPKRKIEFDNLQGEFKANRPYSTYKMYGDSKMALLLITFKLAEELRNKHICVNAIQIPAIKLSKETIQKMQSGWKIAARVQNLFSAPRETMSDTYFHLCTSQEFKGITGKLFDARRTIMKTSHYPDTPRQQIKQFFDQTVYPKYAAKERNMEQVWELCSKLTAVEV